MSKHNNVNPNFYKTGGREHTEGPGDPIPNKREKQKMSAAMPEQTKKPAKPAKKR